MTDKSQVGEIKKVKPPVQFRWLVLVLVSIAMFGNYYVYDSISPVAKSLKDQLQFTDSHIGWLNGIYSLVNIVMVLIGGLIIDRIGARKALFIFGVISLLGTLITCSSVEFWVWFFGLFGLGFIGQSFSQFWIMLTGRLVFGLGAESMIVAINTVLAKWFKGKQLSLAFGLNLFLGRAGSALALNSLTIATPLYENWQMPLILSSIIGVTMVIGAAFYWLFESGADRVCDLGEEETEKIKFKDIFKFSRSFWYITLLCVTFYSAAFPFQTFAIKFFEEAHGTTPQLSGFLSSVLTIFAMFFTPLVGWWVDRVGKRSLFMAMASILMIPVYLMVAYLNISLFIPMAIMGVAFSVIPAVMWPSVAYIVDEKRLGTAYGLMTMVQAVGMWGFNIIIGWANDFAKAGPDNPAGYNLGMWIFSVLGFVALFFSIMLWRRESGPHAHGLETIRSIGEKE